MINVRDEQRDYISISADKEEEKELLKKMMEFMQTVICENDKNTGEFMIIVRKTGKQGNRK